MATELRLNDARNLALLKRKRGSLKLLNHLATRERAQVASVLRRRTTRNRSSNTPELLTLLQSLQYGFGFALGLDKDVRAMNFIWHNLANA